jgi:hypothetical protein
MIYLRRDKAADYLQQNWGFGAVDTLATLATRGGGPRFRKLGRFPVYTEADLDSWAESRLSVPVSSTSELPSKRTA